MTDGEPDYREVMKDRATAQQRSSNRGCLMFVGAVVVIGVALGLAGVFSTDDVDSSSDNSYAAFDICQTFVKRQLRSPGSAKFRNYFQDDGEVSVFGFGNGPYTVSSSVDAQNGFGALIRSDFTCRVTLGADGETWHLETLTGID